MAAIDSLDGSLLNSFDKLGFLDCKSFDIKSGDVLSFSANSTSSPRTNIPDSFDFLNKSAKTVLGQGHCPISLNDFSSISTITEYVLPFVSRGFFFCRISKYFNRIISIISGSEILVRPSRVAITKDKRVTMALNEILILMVLQSYFQGFLLKDK